MTPRPALSKALHILLRLCGIDMAAPRARRSGSAAQFARAKAQRVYTRNGVRMSISPRDHRDRE